MKRSLLASAIALSLLTPVWAQTSTTTAPASAAAASVSAPKVVQHYSRLVYAGYEDSILGAQALQKSVNAFLAKPSAASLDAARKAWLEAREFYGQTEAFRFYDGPIDNEDGPEGQINAWPMDESYVDYVEGDDKAGIINDRSIKLSKKKLAELNEHDGEENVSTGWHAIEFMLWGQDLRADGPGDRAFTDFVDGKKPNADRRRQYLRLVTELLVEDLQSVAAQWKPGVKNNYRATFDKGGEESIRKIFVGLGSLSRGELAGERLEVALASQDQEDEHSCFSDNTHRDAVTNAQGILNVWLGSYTRRDGSRLQGPSLRDLVTAKDAALAQKTTESISGSVRLAEAIPAPFDQAIQGERNAPARAKIQATIDSLTQQSKDLVEAAHAVGISQLNLVQPE